MQSGDSDGDIPVQEEVTAEGVNYVRLTYIYKEGR
jgi:hypothetical protein